MSSARLHVRGGRPLRGRISLPGDLEVAQRAVLLAALAEGRSELSRLPLDSELARTLELLSALGVRLQVSDGVATIEGVGLRGLSAPPGALECGRAWTSLAMCAGLLSGQRFGTRVTVHRSLAQRSVEHLVGPLRARGAQIAGRTAADGAIVAPLAVAPLVEGEWLRGLDCGLPKADPAIKTGLLISALFAEGPTTLAEPYVSADHTERLMVALGLPLRRIGSVVAFDRAGWDARILPQVRSALPGSASSAAQLIAAAQLIEASALAFEGVAINPSVSGVLDVVRLWGGEISVTPTGDAAQREPIGDVRLRQRRLRGGALGAEELVRSSSALSALLLLGVAAQRGAQVFDLDALAPAADPRWTALIGLMQAFGVKIHAEPGGSLRIAGVDAGETQLQPAKLDVGDDAELALAALTLALASPGESVLEHAAEALAASHPGFIEAAQSLGADIWLS